MWTKFEGRPTYSIANTDNSLEGESSCLGRALDLPSRGIPRHSEDVVALYQPWRCLAVVIVNVRRTAVLMAPLTMTILPLSAIDLLHMARSPAD